MERKILNWGFLSTARINKALIEPLRTSPRNELYGIASRTFDRAGGYAKKWKIPNAYASYEDMLADPNIHVVYNPLPNSLHAEWTIKAARAGKHILCEKPLALNTEEVDTMYQAAEGAGVILTEAFMYRHHTQTLQVKELVDQGVIGDLQYIRGTFSFFLDRPGDIRLDPKLGGGSIWDIGCYPISYARLLVGSDPREVFGWQVRSDADVDLFFTGQMRFDNGVLAQFDCSFRTPYRTQIEIVGSQGMITVPKPFQPGLNEHITIHRGSDTERIDIDGELLYIGEVEDMADAVLLGKPPLISREDSRGNVETITALLRSANEGKPVLLRD